MLAVRRRVGRFRSLTHFASELDGRQVNHKVFEMLIKAGCFDAMGHGRRPLYESLDAILAYAQQRRHEREVGQETLFAAGTALEPGPDPEGPEWAEGDRLSFEKEALGFYLTGNPLSEHEEQLARLASHTVAELAEGVAEAVTLGGLVTRVRPTKIKSGKNAGRLMGRFVLEDLTGSVPAILFADPYQQYGHLLEDEAVVVLKGMPQERGSELEVTVDEIVPLKKAVRRLLRSVDVEVDAGLGTRELLELRDLLIEHAGETPLRLQIRLPGRRVRVAPRESFKVRFDPELVESVEGLLGENAVTERYA